jgi:hypothetical protein
MKPRWQQYNRSSARRDSQYRSRNEEVVAEALKSSCHLFSYESHKVPYVKEHRYLPDFTLHENLHVEVKGWMPAEERSKIRAIVRCNPELILVMVLVKPELLIHKTSKTTYGAWCDKNGIPWVPFNNDPALLKQCLENVLLPYTTGAPRATAATVPPRVQTDLFSASSATPTPQPPTPQ